MMDVDATGNPRDVFLGRTSARKAQRACGPCDRIEFTVQRSSLTNDWEFPFVLSSEPSDTKS